MALQKPSQMSLPFTAFECRQKKVPHRGWAYALRLFSVETSRTSVK